MVKTHTKNKNEQWFMIAKCYSYAMGTRYEYRQFGPFKTEEQLNNIITGLRNESNSTIIIGTWSI